jgi:hypothetical protein
LRRWDIRFCKIENVCTFERTAKKSIGYELTFFYSKKVFKNKTKSQDSVRKHKKLNGVMKINILPLKIINLKKIKSLKIKVKIYFLIVF